MSLCLRLIILADMLGPDHKVGRSKPPPVLTSGFNRLKPPRSIRQKVVNTGQYESEWSIEILRGRFRGRLRYKVRIYFLFIEKRKITVLSLARALFTLALTSVLQPRHLTLYILFQSSKAE